MSAARRRSVAAPPVPIAWLKARIKRDKASSSGFVWLKRPRSDFKTEQAFKAWHSTNLGKPAGTVRERRGMNQGHVLIAYQGEKVFLDLRALDIALSTGAWPTGALPSWSECHFVPPRRERVTEGYQGHGILAQFLAAQLRRAPHLTPDDLTVMSRDRDPFRLDIPTMRRDGRWLARQFDGPLSDDEDFHLRGVHYILSSPSPPLLKPNGEPYLNDYSDWRWLLNHAAKAARWLGLVPWERIVDSRNEKPVINWPNPPDGPLAVELLTQLPVPDAADATPTPRLSNFVAMQPFRLVVFFEKAGVEPILSSLAERYQADLYPGVGDPPDRLVWEMARSAVRAGVKLVVFTVTDCDPQGYHMAVVIGRKLQALAVSAFPTLKFEVVRAGLTPAQVTELGLPSSPLKPSEKRADRWRDAFGVEQTELDAAMALQRDAFADAIEQSFARYFDSTLAERLQEAENDWQDDAEAAVAAQTDADEIERLQARYDVARDEIETVNARLAEIAASIELPDPPDPPEADLDAEAEDRKPLIDSAWGFVEGTLKLKADKAYENGGENAGDDDDEG